MGLNRNVVIWIIIFIISLQLQSQDFTHPGAMHSKRDLALIKTKIQSNQQPWKEAYDQFLTSKAASYQGINPKAYASLAYQHHAYTSVKCGSFNKPNVGCNDIVYDGMAAYSLALRFYFTDDIRYAKKAIEIMDAWSVKYRKNEESNSRLVVSWAIPWYVNAAEILRYTADSGWTNQNTSRLNTLLGRFKEYLDWEEDGPANNWTMSQIEARMALAIFQDDRSYFDAAVRKWKQRIKTYIYQTSDGSKPVNAPGNDDSLTKKLWHDRKNRTGTAYVDGLCMETCRDISHTKLGFFSLMNGAEMAWNQGVDLFKAEEKRIADFLELHGDWMLGGKVPKAICDGKLDLVSEDGFELAYSHIHNRLGRKLPNTLQMINRNRPNGAFRWVKKWETLMYAERSFEAICVAGGPDGFADAVSEGEMVVVTDVVDIAYGACGAFEYLYEQQADVPCNTVSFGEDPIDGVVKKCYTRPVFYPNIQSATGSQTPNFPENILDNNMADEQRWSAQGFPQTVVIDYGTAQVFEHARVWTFESRAYQYTIAISNDPMNGFVQVVDRTRNTTSVQPIQDAFEQTKGRYVRLTVIGADNYDGPWASINELQMSSASLSNDVFETNAAIMIYPNPSANGQFSLTKAIEWEIYDLKGVKLQNGKGKTIDLSDYTTGVYFVKSANQVKFLIYQ